MSKQRLGIAAGLLLVLPAVLLVYFLRTELAWTGGRLGVPLDDAWIHYQFARNLSSGQGFGFNPGEPTPGSTAPLWTLLLAGVGLFTEDFLLPSLVLSTLFLLATVGFTYLLAWDVTGRTWAALLAALATLLSGRLLWAGLAGMETTAFAACTVAAVWLYGRQGLRVGPALLFALASQLRPEGHLLFALVLLDTLWGQSGRERPGLKGWVSVLAAYGAVSLPYVLFCLATTGRLLPNTFYAKADAQQFFSWRTLRETLALHWQDNYLSLLLLAAGLLPTWRKRETAGRLTVLWLLGLWLVTPIIVAQVWHHGRYTLPLIPFQMIVAAAGAVWLVERIGTYRPALVRWLPAALLLLIVAAGVWRLPHWAQMLGSNTKEILEIDVAVGEWLRDHAPPGATVAVDDLGAIGYLSGRRILDLQGLVSPELWPALQEPAGLPRQQALARELSHLQPDLLAIFPNWHFELATNERVMRPVMRFWTPTHTIIFDQEAVIYEAEWPYVAQATPQQPVGAMLGEAVTLLGYDLVRPDGALAITLYWQSEAALAEDYDVFIHLLDAQGQVVAQVDEQPLGGLAATSRWQSEDVIRDPHTIVLPESLPAGEYQLTTGLFLRETMARLPVTEPAGGEVVPLGTVTIE